MAETRLYVLYKTPNERRIEYVLGIALGVTVALALRHYAAVPTIYCLFGFAFGYLIVFMLAGVILRREGRMIPAAEAAARRREDVLERSFLSAVVERAIGPIVMVVIVVALIVFLEMPASDVISIFSTTDGPNIAPFLWILLFMATWMVFSAWLRERGARRRLERQERRSQSTIARRLLNWYRAYYALAILLFISGSAAALVTPNRWKPLAAGVVCALILASATRSIAYFRRSPKPGDPVRLIAAMGAVGVLFIGTSMGAVWAAILTFAACVSGPHAFWGITGATKATFLMALIPSVFAVTLVGGFAFGIAMGLFISLLNLLSPMFEIRQTDKDK